MNAKLLKPFHVFVSNGEVFICDTHHNCVRKVLKDGQIVTIAGGVNNKDDVCFPTCVVVSSSNQVYISGANSKILKINQAGMISTIAGTGGDGYNEDNQLAIHAQLNEPRGLFVTEDEEIFVADRDNHRVRKIDRNGIITTVAGTGIDGYNGDDILATRAQLNCPRSVFVHQKEIYIADSENNRIRKVLQNGIITTIAGTGVAGFNGNDEFATSARINQPYGLFVHNDCVYFTDYLNHRVRKILPNGMIKSIAGTGIWLYNGEGKMATKANLKCPAGIFVDDSGVYIACKGQERVRKIDSNGIITTVVGCGRAGFSSDVPFDFEKYPHIGPKKAANKPLIKPFPKALYDLIVHANFHHQNEEQDCDTCYEPLNKKVRR